MKECTRCHLIKPLDQFTKRKGARDGRTSHCNACKAEARRAYLATPEGAAAIKASAKRFRETPHGKTARKAYAARPDQKAQRAAYVKTEKGQAARARAIKRYQEKVAQSEEGQRQLLARLAVTHAVENGHLPHVSDCTCEHCGKPAAAYHHDLGYAKRYWLHVVPLCQRCHQQAHTKSALQP